MNKIRKVNFISASLTAVYFFVFLLMIRDDSCINCAKFLWTIYFVPTLTVYSLGYDDQSALAIWCAVLVEMVLMYLLFKWMIAMINRKFG